MIEQKADIRKYYDENGYVVVRGLLPRDLCDRATASFETEVKPFGGFIYRQASANPEQHVFTDHGFMLNSILNVQSLDPRRFAGFRRTGLDLLTHANMQRAISTILGEPGKLVQSMYFESAPSKRSLEVGQPYRPFRRDPLSADLPDDEKSGYQALDAVTPSSPSKLVVLIDDQIIILMAI